MKTHLQSLKLQFYVNNPNKIYFLVFVQNILHLEHNVLNNKKKDINLCCGVRSSGLQVSFRNHQSDMNVT